MIASRDQSQLLSSLAHFGDLLKTLMFLLNLNSFNFSPSLLDQRFAKWKGSSKMERKGFQVILSLFLSPLLVFVCITCVFCFIILNQSSFMPCFVFICFLFNFGLFCFSYKNKNKN